MPGNLDLSGPLGYCLALVQMVGSSAGLAVAREGSENLTVAPAGHSRLAYISPVVWTPAAGQGGLLPPVSGRVAGRA